MLILALPLFRVNRGSSYQFYASRIGSVLTSCCTPLLKVQVCGEEVTGTLNVTPVSVAPGHFGDLNIDSNRGPPPSGTGFSDDTRTPDREKTEHLV